jgi:arylsulfatase A-like enzyme
MNYTTTLFAALILTRLSPLPAAGAPQAAKPNIVFLVADDLGFTDLTCCGAKEVQTPNLDRFFAQGMRLTRFYSSSSLCSPSRAAMMTGRYPDLIAPVRDVPAVGTSNLVSTEVTLPSALKRAGYRTALVGKWHLGESSPNLPTENGFDDFRGFIGPMLKDYFTHAQQKGTAKGLWHNGVPLAVEGHATDVFTGWAVDSVRRLASSEQPFFLYAPFNAPHSPHQAPPDWLARVRKRHPNIPEGRAQFIAQIEHLDHGIGKVLEAIKTSGAADRTLVVFTSDNGGRPGLTQPSGLRGGKNDLYENGLRVPFCAVWPGRIAPGSESPRLTLGMDLYPTLCEAAGASYDTSLNGRSVLPVLLGRSQPEEERTLIWMVNAGKPAGVDAGKPMYACRRGDWKIVQPAPFKPMELFNLADDPGEKAPLPRAHPEFSRLQQELQNHLVRVISRPAAIPRPEPSAK